MIKPLSFFALAAGIFASTSQAALLIYEGFNGYTAGGAMGATGPAANNNPNGNTVGLNTGVAYAGTGTANYTFTASGMTFGDLQTNGGAVTFSASTAIIAGRMNSMTPVTGNLYSSFLIRLDSMGSGSGNGFESRITNDISTGSNRLRVFADSRSGTINTVALDFTGAALTSDPSDTLATGTDYIIISSFTRVGMSLSVANPGVASLYALTLAQFQNMLTATDREDYLQKATVGGGITNVSASHSTSATTGTGPAFGSVTPGTDHYTQLVSVGDTGKVDELRYGNTLNEVIPLIPEPSTSLLAGLTGLLAISRRKRPALS